MRVAISAFRVPERAEAEPKAEAKAEPKAKAKAEPGKPTLPVALLFPGQGSQYVKMLDGVKDMQEATCVQNPLLLQPSPSNTVPQRDPFRMNHSFHVRDGVPEVKDMLAKASKILGYDLLNMCMEGPEEKLAETRYCQPAMFLRKNKGGAKDKTTYACYWICLPGSIRHGVGPNHIVSFHLNMLRQAMFLRGMVEFSSQLLFSWSHGLMVVFRVVTTLLAQPLLLLLPQLLLSFPLYLQLLLYELHE